MRQSPKTKKDVAMDVEKSIAEAATKDTTAIDYIMNNLLDMEATESSSESGKKRTGRVIADDEDDDGDEETASTITNAEQTISRLALPVSAEFQSPPIELCQPGTDIEWNKRLTTTVTEMKHLLSDFKHGTTLMMKYDSANHRVIIACTDATAWTAYEYSTPIDLFDSMRPAPTADAASMDSSTGVSGLNAMYNESMNIDAEPRVMYADPQAMSTDKRSQHAPDPILRTVLCKNFAKGKCTFGDKCRFSHSG